MSVFLNIDVANEIILKQRNLPLLVCMKMVVSSRNCVLYLSAVCYDQGYAWVKLIHNLAVVHPSP